MGEGDHMPIGGHKRKVDPKHVQAIKEGGKKAKQIRELADKHQQEIDAPKAEEDLLKELEELNK